MENWLLPTYKCEIELNAHTSSRSDAPHIPSHDIIIPARAYKINVYYYYFFFLNKYI